MNLQEHNMNGTTGTWSSMVVIVAMVVWMAANTAAWAAQDCLSATGAAAVSACRSELLHDPGNVEIRFALSDAFMSLKRYEDAVAVLRDGFEHAPGDDRIKKKLLLAESYLEEQRWIDEQNKKTDAAAGSRKAETQVRLSVIRCKKFKGDAAVNACSQGLAVDPGNPELLTGRGNAWLEMGRFGDAIFDFESALAADPQRRDAAKNLRLAHTKRKVKAAQCLQGDGPKGLAACDAALMQGASDAFDIQKKRAALLHALGRDNEAAEAYREAARLNPADDQVSRALAALRPSDTKPTAQAVAKTPPAQARATVAANVERPAPVEKKPLAESATPVRPAEKAVAVKPKPPPKAVPAKTTATAPAPREVKQPLPAPPKSQQVAAVRPLQYSNATEVT